LSAAPQPVPSSQRPARRVVWGERPSVYPASHPRAGQSYPRNTHRPRFAFQGQDVTPNPRTRIFDRATWHRSTALQIQCPKCGAAKYFQCQTNGRWTEIGCCPERKAAAMRANIDPRADRYIEVSNSQLAHLLAEAEKELTGTPRVRMPRSTTAYQRDVLTRRARWTLVDPHTLQPCQPRTPGDGRQRSMYRLHSYDRTLTMISKDQNIAVPQKRSFYVIDGRPLTNEEAKAWKLDAALAKNMPEVWAQTACRFDPDAALRPLQGLPQKAKLRPATDAEIETVSSELSKWDVTHNAEQAARILLWGRVEVPEITGDQMAEAIRRDLKKRADAWHQKNRYAAESGRKPPLTYGLFSADSGAVPRGMARAWKYSQQTAGSATLTNPPPDEQAGPGPPAEFRNLRTRLTS